MDDTSQLFVTWSLRWFRWETNLENWEKLYLCIIWNWVSGNALTLGPYLKATFFRKLFIESSETSTRKFHDIRLDKSAPDVSGKYNVLTTIKYFISSVSFCERPCCCLNGFPSSTHFLTGLTQFTVINYVLAVWLMFPLFWSKTLEINSYLLFMSLGNILMIFSFK